MKENSLISAMKMRFSSFAKQAAIVEPVEALMTTYRALEAEIEHTRSHADHLLQTVLKEALGPT